MRGKSLLVLIVSICAFVMACSQSDNILENPAAPASSAQTNNNRITAGNPTVHATSNAAGIIDGFTCGILDSNGGVFAVNVNTHKVVTNSANGNRNIVCSGTQPIPAPDRAIVFRNFICNVCDVNGLNCIPTTTSHAVIDTQGRATTSCHAKINQTKRNWFGFVVAIYW